MFNYQNNFKLFDEKKRQYTDDSRNEEHMAAEEGQIDELISLESALPVVHKKEVANQKFKLTIRVRSGDRKTQEML